jgi:hypothetical protein
MLGPYLPALTFYAEIQTRLWLHRFFAKSAKSAPQGLKAATLLRRLLPGLKSRPTSPGVP